MAAGKESKSRARVKKPIVEITLRPITPDDTELLYTIYASTRADEMMQIGWPEAAQATFLRQQFNAQAAYYGAHYNTSRFALVIVEGQVAGRLYVDRMADEILIIDMAILPPFRGQGIGTTLFKMLLQEGTEAHLPVTMHVEATNPALRLYARLGFEIVEDNVVYLKLQSTPFP